MPRPAHTHEKYESESEAKGISPLAPLAAAGARPLEHIETAAIEHVLSSSQELAHRSTLRWPP
jgi:hypothetical protein